MPIEDPRNLREVGIFLRSLERSNEAQTLEIKKDLDELKAEIVKGSLKKTQYTLIILSSIVSPCIVALIAIVIKNSFMGV